MPNTNLKIVPLDFSLWDSLSKFFLSIKDNKFFPSSRFVSQEMLTKSGYKGNDFYCALMLDDEVLGYGFLRGWDDKWDDICLGIVIKPELQRRGYGQLLISFLHAAGKARGLKRIRLHVKKGNKKAISLYEKMGYEFASKRNNGELIGFKQL